jgi:hypothetical protein
LIIGTVARKESVALIKEKKVLLSAGLPKVIMGIIMLNLNRKSKKNASCYRLD